MIFKGVYMVYGTSWLFQGHSPERAMGACAPRGLAGGWDEIVEGLVGGVRERGVFSRVGLLL